MEKFIDKTESLSEPAVKTGNYIPKNAVNLSWFSSKPITPENNIVTTDLSSLIPENITPVQETEKIMIPNELGFLEDLEGNSYLDFDEIHISNIPLNENVPVGQYSLESLSSKNYAMTYYVSRFFTLTNSSYFPDASIYSFTEEKYIPKNIQVLDSFGNHYVDNETGRKKYRIELESFIVNPNYQLNEIPHRIIVFLEDFNTNGFSLIYDKVECDADGKWFNQILRYKETINAKPIYRKVQEESEVIDPYNSGEAIYSVKRNTKDKKVNNSYYGSYANQVVVNKKAVEDNRDFQVFNWRIIGKVKSSVQLNQVAYGNELNDVISIRSNNIKVGVLYSSAVSGNEVNEDLVIKAKPYVFYNLENSPFNITNINFVNPNSSIELEAADKSSAQYWLVDIDTITDEQISQYDLLALSLHWKLTVDQGLTLNRLIESYGSLVIDTFSAPPNALENFDTSLSQSSAYVTYSGSQSESYNTSNRFNVASLNNAFDINTSKYAQDCGIYGYSKNAGFYKNYMFFDNESLTPILSINGNKVFASKRYVANGDSHRASNVVVSTTGFLSYANAVYPREDAVAENNFGIKSIAISPSTDESGVSPYVEGPLQFLYNVVAVALNDKIESTRRLQDLSSNIHYFTTKWQNNWVIDSNALFEDEINQYFSYRTVNEEAKLVRDIIDNPKVFYISEIEKITPSIRQVFLDQNNLNIDLFIEYTNSNVSWTNAESPSSSEIEDLSSSYNVVKISSKDSLCSVYSNVLCKPFQIPSDFGAYIIKDKVKKYNDQVFLSKENNIGTSPFSQIKNYNFTSALAYYKNVLQNGPKYFDVNIDTELTVTFQQTGRKIQSIDQIPIYSPPKTEYITTPSAQIVVNSGSFLTSQETESQKKLTTISDPLNVYSYTFDIGKGNVSTQFKQGSSGDYVRYIQYTLNSAGFNTTADGSFGSRTKSSVENFQTSRGIFVDGVVDSQTKMYLGLYWASLNEGDWNLYIYCAPNEEVRKYMRAARVTRTAQESLNSNQPVRLLNFTDVNRTKDPVSAQIWISFQIPNDPNMDQVLSVTLVPLETFSTKADSYDGIEILDYVISPSFTFSSIGARKPVRNANKKLPITININQAIHGQWISILVKGSSLGGGFGNKAEGIGISDLYYTYKTKATTQAITIPGDLLGYKQRENWVDVTRDVTSEVYLPVRFNDVSATDITKTITAQDVLSRGVIKSITLYNVKADQITDDEIFLGNLLKPISEITTGVYEPAENLRVNLKDPRQIRISGAVVKTSDSPKEAGNADSQVYPNSYIDFSFNQFEMSIKASRVPYTHPDNFYFKKPIENYKLKSAITGQIRNGTNTVNFYDGPMLICQEDGSPYTIDLSTISNSISGSVANSDIELVAISQSGLHYGFYDNSPNAKNFIGKRISFLRYINNIDNIYPAVYAYDYDGNLDTNVDFDGLNQSTFPPVEVPVKTAYPVFKVSLNKSNKIQLLEMQKGLQKTEPWPISISSGSFLKEINTSEVLKPTGFLADYKGQTLFANYDTSVIKSVPSSKIYGKGYLDIINESPKFINGFTIQTKQYPIHFVHSKSSDLIRFAAPFDYALSVYTRQDTSSAWVKVNNSLIKDVNAANGLIEFTSPIISSDPSLTKVDYTVKIKGIPVKQSSGIPIPTNPFLNKGSIKINKPLYIYILPKEIYKTSSLFFGTQDLDPTKDLIKEYSYDSIVNFTYDNNIFNKNDIVNYNPLALLIGIVYCINNFRDEDFSVRDLRVKGGGVSANFDTNRVLEDIEESISYWDVYPPLSEAYPKGGYVIVRIPASVKKNFTNPDEVYTIVRNNLTAGVVFDIQDMNGQDWGSSVTPSS